MDRNQPLFSYVPNNIVNFSFKHNWNAFLEQTVKLGDYSPSVDFCILFIDVFPVKYRVFGS